jgi:hypothetical protein
MLLEAAETVLGYFGFDSIPFGDTIRKKNGGVISGRNAEKI